MEKVIVILDKIYVLAVENIYLKCIQICINTKNQSIKLP